MLLKPGLRVIGIGVEPMPGDAWAVVVDVVRGVGGSETIVVYPPPNQRDVPVTFAGGPEIPDPDAAAGFPVTVTFPPLRKVTQVKAELRDDAGQTVDVWLSTPEKPVHEKGQRNTIALIAKAPCAAIGSTRRGSRRVSTASRGRRPGNLPRKTTTTSRDCGPPRRSRA